MKLRSSPTIRSAGAGALSEAKGGAKSWCRPQWALAFVTLLVFGNTGSALAQFGSFWQSTGGPKGALARDLVEAPDGTMFAVVPGVPRSLLRFDDVAGSWVEDLRPGASTPFQLEVTAFEVSPAGGFYLGSESFPEFSRSLDGGQTWEPITIPTNPHRTPSRIRFTDSGALVATMGPRVYRAAASTLAQNPTLWTWELVENFLVGFHDLAVAPGGVVLAATFLDGLLRSVDDGVTFDPVASLAGVEVTRVALQADGSLLAGSRASGIFFSSDGGLTWSPDSTGLPAGAVLAIHPSANGDAYVSIDGAPLQFRAATGTSWSDAALQPDGWRASALLERSDGTTVVSTTAGISGSAGSGLAWSTSSSGFPPSAVTSIVQLAGGEIVAGGSGGVYRSVDGGATWVPSAHETPSVIALVEDPAGGILAAIETTNVTPLLGPSVYTGIPPTAFLRSDDAGDTWSPIPSPPVFTPSLLKVYALVSGPGVILAETNFGVYGTFDGGHTWSSQAGSVPTGGVRQLIWANGAFYAWNQVDERVYHSLDSGVTWSGVGVSPGIDDSFPDFMASPSGRFFVFGRDEGDDMIFESTDQGATWMPIAGPDASRSPVGLWFADDESLLITNQNGVFRLIPDSPTSTEQALAPAPPTAACCAFEVLDSGHSAVGTSKGVHLSVNPVPEPSLLVGLGSGCLLLASLIRAFTSLIYMPQGRLSRSTARSEQLERYLVQ